MELPITLFIVLRLAAAALVALGAACIVLARRPRESLPMLVRGLICAALLAVVLGVSWRTRSHSAGLGTLVRTLAGISIGVVALALLAAAVHFCVRAFQFGRIHDDPTGSATRPG